MSDFNYIEYLKNNPLLKKDTNKLITESQEVSKSSKIKKSDLKAKIREEILATLNEEDESLDEAKKDEEEVDAEVDAPIEDEMGAEVDAPEIGGSVEGLTGDEQKIQNSLKIAYDNAVAIGDQKLADQIGNSITFFTRTHVVER